MAYYNKIGLLIINDRQTKFLVCVPGKAYGEKQVRQYLIPGGQIEKDESDQECLAREIKEELACDIDKNSLKFVGEYTDLAASGYGRDVTIKLYQGKLIGEPKPSSEIGQLRWIGKETMNDEENNSPIVRNKIIPDLLNRAILK